LNIFQINNPSTGLADFVVPDQATADTAGANNPSIGSVAIGTQADAQAKLQARQVEFMTSNAVRFSICTEVQTPDGVMWREVSSTDPDVGTYQVFDTFTGQYTKHATLTEAKQANQSLQQQLLVAVGLDVLGTPAELPKPPKQPTTTGTQTV
jgi:hypothetical protein